MSQPNARAAVAFNDALLEVLFFILGLLLAVAVGLGSKDKNWELGVVVGLTSFSAAIVCRLAYRAIKYEDDFLDIVTHVHQTRGSVEQLQNDLSTLSRERSIDKLRNSFQGADWVSVAGRRTLQEYLDWLEPYGTGLKANGEQLALLAYKHFWEELARSQRQRKMDNAESLVARVTHSSSPQVWANKLLDQQEEFVRMGGTIVRVFLDDQSAPPPQVKAAMEMMERLKIKVFYLRNNNIDELQNDFLWVDPCAVEWRADGTRRQLQECRIATVEGTRRQQIESQWLHIGRQVINCSETVIDSQTKAILTSFSGSAPGNARGASNGR